MPRTDKRSFKNMDEYEFLYESSLEHYTAEAFTLRCFDDRFWKAFKNFLKQEGLKHIDPESVAGGVKILATPEKESDRDFMLREIEKSIRLHHTKKIMLFSHHACGAYGGFEAFGNDRAEEFRRHKEEHQKAHEVIKNHFSFHDLAIESYFIDEKGVQWVV